MNIKRAIYVIFSLFFINIAQPVLAQTADSLKQLADTTTLLKADTVAVKDSLKRDTVKVATDTTTKKADSTQAVIIDTVKRTASHTNGYVFNGKVEDYTTGEGIPFANVFFANSPVGTPTDLNGNFQLKTDKIPRDTLRIQALGYTSYTLKVNKGQHEYNFIAELKRSNTQLTEFVVHASGVDPALLLLRHIIAHKPDNDPDRMDNYKYEADNRLEMDVRNISKKTFEKIPGFRNYSFIYNNMDSVSEKEPFLPIYLTETLSDYYSRKKPKKEREFIKGSIAKGVNNQSAAKYLGNLYQQVDVYKNNLRLFDKQFVSPISNDGAFYYKYKILDTEVAYGHNIILMQYQPRRPGENCFTGDFWVVDSLYALQRITMELPKLANVDWVQNATLYQEFAPINDSVWFRTKDKFVGSFSIPYAGAKWPSFIGRKTTTFDKIVVNDPSVESVLNNKKWKEDVTVLDSARKRSDSYWQEHRPDTLTKTEKGIYKMVDTINSMPITKFYKNLINFLVIGTKDVGPIQLGPYFYIYSSNQVEGNRFRLSLGTPLSFSNNIHLTGYVAYGTLDERYKYGFTGLWLLQRHPRMYVYGQYIHDVDYNPNYYDQLGSDNIFSSLFRKPNVPWKLAFSDKQRFEFYKEYYSGFSDQLILQHRAFTPYAPLPAANIFTDDKGNPTSTVTNSEVGLHLRYAYKEKFLEGKYLRVSLGSRYPIFDLNAGVGLKNVWNSGYGYQKVRFTVSNTLKIAPFGSLYYNVFAGKYFGTLPYPLLEIHPGNEFYYYNQYAFEMMNMYEFISDQFAGFNIENNIGGGIFKYIPGLKKLKLRQVWTAKGLIGSLSPANEELNLNKGYPFRSLQGDPYLELGTGITNIFQLFRIDFVWRVTPPLLPTEGKQEYFGIFGSVNVGF